jgi:NAD(P)-dependent dehydrogenase (short-subunit alcohol dehydrogenase family)
MSRTIMIVGYGPGTATAVAEKFGKNGFSVALIGRNADRLAAGAAALKAQGISASAFSADAGDPESIRAAVRNVRSQLGPITVLHWNAYGGTDVADLLTTDAATLHKIFDVAVFGLIAATEEALPDLKQIRERSSSQTAGLASSHRRQTQLPSIFISWVSRFRAERSTSSSACSHTV